MRICHNHSNTCCYRRKDGLILPLSYRFISLEELQSQQKTPCCSQLTWSTRQFKQWTVHKESLLMNHKALSRTNLLLCGILTDKTSITPSAEERQEQHNGGILYLQDKSGFIPCEVIKLDARWLGQLVLLPSWSYIPLTAVRRLGGTEAGYLEIIEAPFLVFPKLLVGSLLASNTLNVLLPESAIHLLDKGFYCPKVKMNIAGELGCLCSLIHIRGKTFFFFFLNSFETEDSLPVLVQVPAKLMWHHCLEVSKQYVITKVFISSLQGTNYKVFVVSSSSDFYQYDVGSVKEQTLAEFMNISHMKQTFKSELTSLACKEESFQNRSSVDWSTQHTVEEMFKSRESKICSYRGMISKVLNVAAGLYELDGKFGLCVAYQQLVNYGRGLRPGAQVEVLPSLPSKAERPNILHGIFQANYRTGRLQLLDTSGTLDCVVLASNEVNQIAFSDTSYLDCLVQLQKYQLVIERFIHSEFPSSKQLDDPRFIKEKHTRIYVQFCAADLQVLKRRAVSTRPKLLIPALSSTLSTSARTAARSSCNEACKNDELNSITSNQHQDGPSLPKMPRLEEVVLQEGHVGESRRTVCSHPLWTGDEAVGIPGQGERLPGTGTPAGRSTACTSQRRKETRNVGCVTQLIVVTHKDALMLRNCQYGRNEGCEHTNGSGEAFVKKAKPKLRLAFQASAVHIGSPREWKDESKIEGLPELEADPSLCSEHNNRTQVLLNFVGKAVKWYHLINPGGVYRLIASKQLGTSAFEQRNSTTIPEKALQSLNCPLFLSFQPGWNLQYISTVSCLHRSQLFKNLINLSAYFENLASEITHLCTIQEVLSCSFSAPLVSFTGIILERICYNPNIRANFAAVITDKNAQGISVPGDWGLKLTVGDVQNTTIVLHIYIDFMMLSYILGILPGTVVTFHSLERVTSRHNNVYCKYVPSSSVSMLENPSPEAVRSASADLPLLYLGNLISVQGNHLQGIVCCHVVNIHWLKLQWVCSLCCSIVKQGKCTRSSGPCPSAVAIFRANASATVEDGTAVARVYCKDKQVADLLALGPIDWERLQHHIGPQGEVYFQCQGRTGYELHEENTEDILMQYLGVVCTSTIVCRSIQLAFRFESRSKSKIGQNETFQLRTFSCGDHQYMTKMTPALSLTCLDIKEVDYRKLCHLANDRLIQ
ncbi:hypothetical protein chiPu_0012850 [Chiloscyllium punctatum]|uniref:CST complex subunit CTC1 n=1 Tax=Chiloscyllium punctatum TaxID=137246 RepID=A0A401SVE3_CHIPU|nr:hypothetical protein [Chiloscyllium punctatum]